MSLSALKDSHLGQLNSESFALLSTRFSILKIDHLLMRIATNKTMGFYIFTHKANSLILNNINFSIDIKCPLATPNFTLLLRVNLIYILATYLLWTVLFIYAV
ncbi:hypothetical protein AN391_03560 [Pseudoalteromonas sp. P1-13-1a]|nr:hypothetical protein AN391_03560 [Pseudoalteromonas sp. P1-13-1a]